MSWDGERTVTFTMEDALISPEGLAILTGAGLINASTDTPIIVHVTEKHVIGENKVAGTCAAGVVTLSGVEVKEEIYKDSEVYLMILDADDNLVSEPFTNGHKGNGELQISGKTLSITDSNAIEDLKAVKSLNGYKVLVDYYTPKRGNAKEINITPDKFGGAFYIEASTLFREYPSQQDLPAEFIIPNGRVQSNFTFSMAGSGDPSTFTFTVDAFPDYTRFNQSEKVLATIQVIGGNAVEELEREATATTRKADIKGQIVDKVVSDADMDLINAAIAAIANINFAETDAAKSGFNAAAAAVASIQGDAILKVTNYATYAYAETIYGGVQSYVAEDLDV
jgi:hypothetical protein